MATLATATPGNQSTNTTWLARTTVLVPAAICVGILIVKILLVRRININWDEFFFLSLVHESARGELTLLLQGAYTHLFRWLTWLDANEADQIVLARLTMTALLMVTALLVWRLASRWVSAPAALIAPLCYLSVSAVLHHGGSFRADSILAPLSVLIPLILTREPITRRSTLAAGAWLGVAAAISIKIALLLPAIVALTIIRRVPRERRQAANVIIDLGLIATTSAAVAAALLFAHRLTLSPSAISATTHAAGALSKAVLEIPFFPRWWDYSVIKDSNHVPWLLITGGAVCAAVFRRYWQAAVCGLALLPILFYRNAWAYYYVVMLGPACVLSAVAAQCLRDLVGSFRNSNAPNIAIIGLALLLAWNAVTYINMLRDDRQLPQRAVIEAVHRIFETPVPYVDHSGMIASFRKVNFFMSTWGLEVYKGQGVSFVEQALAVQAPLLIANRAVLIPGNGMYIRRLLPRDRELIERFYQPYWGPIRVAGVKTEIRAAAVDVALPFPGRYRIEGNTKVTINGTVRDPGEIVEFDAAIARVGAVGTHVPASESADGIRLIWAAAKPPPPERGPDALYTSLLL